MKLKLNWKLFVLMYVLIFAYHLFSVAFMGAAVSETTGVLNFLLFSPVIAFIQLTVIIVAAYIVYDLVKSKYELQKTE